MTTISTKSNGRFGNQFVRHLVVCILAEKHDLHVTYGYYELISEQLCVFLYSGKNIHSDSIILDNFNYIPIFQQSEFLYNLNPNIHYFQTREISQLINNYLHRDDIKENIIRKNPFSKKI